MSESQEPQQNEQQEQNNPPVRSRRFGENPPSLRGGDLKDASQTPAGRIAQREGLRSAAQGLKIGGGNGPARYDGVDAEGRQRRPRIFVRGLDSVEYNLAGRRTEQLENIPRVFRGGFDPGTEPYKSQSLHMHFHTVRPSSRNEGHGHQNEALFYVLDGYGWEEHDGKEYPWEEGDAVAVHNDSVHWHCNGSDTNTATSLVLKAKPMWLFMGLMQQGEIGYRPPDLELRGPRVPWTVGRKPEDEALKKVLKPTDTPWEWSEHGYMRKIAGSGVPLRIKATTAYLQEIAGGSRSGKRWQMGDEVVYVLEGSGHSLHWDVAAEIDDQYYARVALEPTEWKFSAGDTMWIPPNTVFQHFNDDPSNPLKFITAHNTAFEWMGYQEVDMEPCPEWEQEQATTGAR